jgi:hypothetical protein
MKFKKTRFFSLTIAMASIFFAALVCHAAYHHGGDTDSDIFRAVYPDVVGTKLDSCNVCHSGGKTLDGKTTLGSCQWCHYKTDYGKDLSEATLLTTLNLYGKDYKTNGRNTGALQVIYGIDSDSDNFTNQAEIAALTYPGDANDDPTKVPAPFRVISLDEFENMPQHSQLLLMNASKSDDSYTNYSGVALENLIKAIMCDSATGATVYSPDGFATYHPFEPSTNTNTNSYHVFGIYPQGTFYYDSRADIDIYPADPPKYADGGWCDYSSPSTAGRANNTAIFNAEGLKMMLAFERDGEYLAPGVLNLQNKLDGEGPFRVIPPQKNPGWPDQRSSAVNQTVVWPYDPIADHNAGFSSRTVTMIRVEPLPAGTTDINTLEAGWPYVDEKKIVIYGDIDPYPLDNLNRNLDRLTNAIKSQPDKAFKVKSSKISLGNKIEAIEKQVATGSYSAALTKLKNDVLKKMDGYLSGAVDADDWIKDLKVQKELCFEIQKIWVMLVLVGA